MEPEYKNELEILTELADLYQEGNGEPWKCFECQGPAFSGEWFTPTSASTLLQQAEHDPSRIRQKSQEQILQERLAPFCNCDIGETDWCPVHGLDEPRVVHHLRNLLAKEHEDRLKATNDFKSTISNLVLTKRRAHGFTVNRQSRMVELLFNNPEQAEEFANALHLLTAKYGE